MSNYNNDDPVRTRFPMILINNKNGNRGGKATAAKKDKAPRFGAPLMESLKKTQMSPDLSTVMAQTNSTIHVVLQANGTATFNLRDATGNSIADERDLRAVSGLNMAVNEERKLALKESINKGVIHKCAAVKQVLIQKGRYTGSLPEGFPDVVKTTQVVIDILNESVASIKALEFGASTAEDTLKSYLLQFAERAQSGIGDYLLHRAGLQIHEEAKKLNSFIREAKCPEYIYKRLTDKSLTKLASDFNIRHVFFPADPSKGFYLTFRELKEESMDLACFQLCSANAVNNVLLSDNFLKHMLRLDDDGMEDLVDFDDVKVLGSKVASVPFYYPAPAQFADIIGTYNFLAKNGRRGIPFRSGNTLSPQEFVRFFGIVSKKVSALGMSTISHWDEFNQVVFPGFVFDPLSEGKDYFVQLKEWAIQPANVDHRGKLFRLQEVHEMKPETVGESIVCLREIQLLGRAVLTVLGVDAFSAHAAVVKKFFALDQNEGCFVKEVPRVVPLTKDEVEAQTKGASSGQVATTKTVNERINVPFAQALDLGVFAFETKYSESSMSLKSILGYVVDYTEARVQSILGDTEYKALREVKEPKDNKRLGLVERSPLGPVAQGVVARLQAQRKTSLATRMASWFRLFLTLQVQASVAQMVAARLDVLFETPIEFNATDYGALYEPGFLGKQGGNTISNEIAEGAAAQEDDDGYEAEP